MTEPTNEPAAEPTTDDILLRVEERLSALGLSDREVSIRATGKPDAVRELRRGKRPSDMRLRHLAEALETTVYFLRGEPEDAYKFQSRRRSAEERLPETPKDEPFLPYYKSSSGSSTNFENEEFEISMEQPILMVARPRTVQPNAGIYAIWFFDKAITPKFDVSDVSLVDPRTPVAKGDYALIRLKSAPGQPAHLWRACVRRITKIEDDGWEVQQHTPPEYYKLQDDEVVSVHRILTSLEILVG